MIFALVFDVVGDTALGHLLYYLDRKGEVCELLNWWMMYKTCEISVFSLSHDSFQV